MMKKINATGIVAGAFDIIHPGYIQLFIDAHRHCYHLTVALHVDPCIENPSKPKPILSVEDRFDILHSIKYVDAIITYHTEEQLEEIMKHFDIKINGEDHKNDGKDWGIPEVFVDRSHGWSETKLKRMIYDSVKEGLHDD